MPDLWDTNPEHVFNTPGEQPDPAPNGPGDHTKEGQPKDPSGHPRLPAYLLLALGTALFAILLMIAGLLLAPE